MPAPAATARVTASIPTASRNVRRSPGGQRESSDRTECSDRGARSRCAARRARRDLDMAGGLGAKRGARHHQPRADHGDPRHQVPRQGRGGGRRDADVRRRRRGDRHGLGGALLADLDAGPRPRRHRGPDVLPDGRYLDANGKETNDPAQAAKDPNTGQPVTNGARDLWVTQRALATGLELAFVGEQISLFSITADGLRDHRHRPARDAHRRRRARPPDAGGAGTKPLGSAV